MNKKGFIIPSMIAVALSVLYLRSPLAKVNIYQQKRVKLNNIKAIKLHAAAADVEILPSKDDQLVLTWTGKRNKCIQEDALQIEHEQGKMNIHYQMENHLLSVIDGSKYEMKLRLEIPPQALQTLQVHTSSGDICIHQMVCDDIVLDSNSGDQTIIETKAAKQLKARAMSGDVTAEKLDTKNAVLQTTSGDIRVKGEQLKMHMDLETSSGDVITQFKQEPESFKVDFKGKSKHAHILIDDLNFEKQEKDQLVGIKGGADYKVKVKTAAGDFTFA